MDNSILDQTTFLRGQRFKGTTFLRGQRFKGKTVNRTFPSLQGGSIEKKTMTVPLRVS